MLGKSLRVHDTKLNPIGQHFIDVEERKKAVIKCWLETDPTPSWRRLIVALDQMRQHEVAETLHPYAEPQTGMLTDTGL